MAVDLRSTSLSRVSNLCMAEIEIRVSSLKLELLRESDFNDKVEILSCVPLHVSSCSLASAIALQLNFWSRPRCRNARIEWLSG